MSSIRLADIEVHYTVAGQGPPVVLLHGLAEDRASWCQVQSELRDFRTFAYDLRGHGETSAGDGEGTLKQLGLDLVRFLETVTGPAACIGYSLGGTVVIWAAAHRPDLVTHVVVAGTSSIVGRRAGSFFDERIRLIDGDFNAFKETLRGDTASQLVAAPAELDKVTARRLAAVGAGRGYANAARAMMALVEHPITPLLERISCPVDVIGGEKDAFCPRKAADVLIASLKNAVYHEIDGAGHLMSVDNPAAYARAIDQSLRRSNEP
ncbi:MAG: alpha/beta fold hydrolase [Hyphomicrobiales bacterium]|nr:alpha/beta fold hydrolase [Hyphomicrobiales bacterium]